MDEDDMIMDDDDGDEESVDADLWQTGYDASPEDGPFLANGLPNPMYGYDDDDE